MIIIIMKEKKSCGEVEEKRGEEEDDMEDEKCGDIASTYLSLIGCMSGGRN